MKLMRWVLMLAAAGAGRAAEAAVDPQSEGLAACAACHGERGEGMQGSEYFPHLAGKPAGYLFDQLRAFRDGQRSYPQMSWLLRNLGDDYLQRVALFYASLPAQSQAARATLDEADALRARQLVEQGDAGRELPACQACHGANLAGIEPGVPALLGLPADYVVAQLGAWRTGVRRARAPDCMAEIARRLDVRDLRLLGAWLSQQGGATPIAPAPAGRFELPRDCGAAQAGAPR